MRLWKNLGVLPVAYVVTCVPNKVSIIFVIGYSNNIIPNC